MNLWFWHSACCPILFNIYMKFMKISWKVLNLLSRQDRVCSGTGLWSRNSQTCTTRFRISEQENQVPIVPTLSIGVSLRLTNYSNWDSCLLWCMGVKNSQMCIQTKTSPRLEIIARWGPLPVSMVLRSERRLKSKMLSLSADIKSREQY